MAEIRKLLESLHGDGDGKPPADLLQRIRLDSVKPGFERLLETLEYGVSQIGGGELGFQQWSEQEIEAIVTILKFVLTATISLRVEKSVSFVCQLYKLAVEFCISLLEKSVHSNVNTKFQKLIVQTLEMSLFDGMDKDSSLLPFDTVNALVALLPKVKDNSNMGRLTKRAACSSQDEVDSSTERQPINKFVALIASQTFQLGFGASQSNESVRYCDPDSMIYIVKNWAVVHAGCINRLVVLCYELLKSRQLKEEQFDDLPALPRLSFVIRVLRLLGNLVNEMPFVGSDVELLYAVASVANILPSLFLGQLDTLSCEHPALENSVENVLVLLLEGFFQFIRSLYSDANVFQNIQACIIASLFSILEAKIWRNDKTSATQKPPLVYCPKIAMYILKLLKQFKGSLSGVQNLGNCFDMGLDWCSPPDGSPAFLVHAKNVKLLQTYACDEHLELMFPVSGDCLDNLVHLTSYLYLEGMKSRPKADRSEQTCAMIVSSSDDTTANNDDEALFGDLFSEATRQVAVPDGHNQSTIAANSISHSYAPLQAVVELLNFFKDFMLSPEWLCVTSRNACLKLNEIHISTLISMLCGEVVQSDESCSDGGALSGFQKQIEKIREACFDLLRGLITHHKLHGCLEEVLVDQVLKVENGNFVYNDYTLALVSYALISGADSSQIQLRRKTFEGYITFVLDKVKLAFNESIGLKEISESMPSIYHTEILLMAFHLSTEAEKVVFANLVLAGIRTIHDPPAEFSGKQISLWSLVVSRLLVVLRHMVFYSSKCPSWLLLHLRSKLMAIASKPSVYQTINDHSLSWASVVVHNILCASAKEASMIGILNHQLFDTVPVPTTVHIDDHTLQNLGLSVDELFSTISRFVGFWRSKKPEAVEELVLERYFFIICWDTVASVASISDISDSISLRLDIEDPSYFIFFSHLLLSGAIRNIGVQKLADFTFGVLLHAAHETFKMQLEGWDFLRNGAWISLLLSLLQLGVWKVSMEKGVAGVKLFQADWRGEEQILSVAESLVVNIIKGGQLDLLFKLLSSLLTGNVQALQESFIHSLDTKGDVRDALLPLLKHTGLGKHIGDGLLSKIEAGPDILDSLCSLATKLLDLNSDENLENANHILLRCLLYGFPSNTKVSSGALVSCVLSVESIILTLDGLLKIKNAVTDVYELDLSNIHLDTVMSVKTDKIFGHISENCESICRYICSCQQSLDYGDLFLLKHLESLLKEASSKEEMDTNICEAVISSTVDTIEHLKKNVVLFKICMGVKDDLCQHASDFYSGQHGILLVLMDALDNCIDDLVNVKVLHLFTDLLGGHLCPGLGAKLQKKFLQMEIVFLSRWIGKRLLGSMLEPSGGDAPAKGSSISLREVTMNFLANLVSSSSDVQTIEFHGKLIEAMLVLLDSAFIQYDIHTAKSYFNFIVQLSNGGSELKQLLEKTLLLMGRLSHSENLYPGLRFLFGFVGAAFSASGASKASDRGSGKRWSYGNSIAGSDISRQVSNVSRKSSELFSPPVSQESGSAAVDCDATSVDEDDDDGTSDGELASMDKDDDDDSNSERALASKVCTFTSSGSNFMEQHWYFCYTCDLTVSKGCCSVCAKVCHKGHRVVYSRSSRFFCDCGAGGVRGSSCQCLKPRKFSGSVCPPPRSTSNFNSFLPFPDGDQLPENDSDFEDDDYVDFENVFKLSIPREEQESLRFLLAELDFEVQVLEICQKLMPAVASRRDANLSKDQKVMLGEDKVLSYNAEPLQLKKAYKSGSLDLKIKTDYSNARELKSVLACGSLFKSLLTVSTKGRLAVGEGDRVAVYDIGQVIGQPNAVSGATDKANFKPLSRNIVRFEIVHLMFNPIVENYLAVAGYEDCQVLSLNPRGEVTDRLPVELALQGAYIRRVDWVPGSQVQLMVVTNNFVKIYDLSKDNISPSHYFTLQDDLIVDATLILASKGRMFLLVLSDNGNLFRLQLSVEVDVGAKVLSETICVKEKHSKGMSLFYSSAYRLLFLSFHDGISLVGRLDANVTALSEVSAIYDNEQDGKLRPAGLYHWKELLDGCGVFVCFSSVKPGSVLAVSVGPHELMAQNLRHTAGAALPLVGITAYKPVSKNRTHCISLHDDGSLQVYSFAPMGADVGSNLLSDQAKKLGSCILTRSYAALNPEFPLDFFEKTICITQDIKLSGDAIQNSDSENTKQNLASEDGFLESPNPSGFKVTVINSNPDIVMVGFRVQVGNTSTTHIPSEISIFQRVIKLEEGLRSWYDIPFTIAEALLSDEELIISIGPTFNGTTLPRIDSLEVYGRAKDEFGWKEKMDAVLNMEAHALASSSGSAGTGKKLRSLQATSVQEQVIADGLKLLSGYYSLCKVSPCSEIEGIKLEPSRFRCKKLLETIFESDKEQLLQSAACLLLQSLFPERDTYYQVKDTMRLLGVMKSLPILASRIGVGGATSGWLIQEFTAQMLAVSKIVLHRRSNMAAFLETHGSGVVDGLIEVLWGILDSEQPDTQTINSVVIPSVELIYSYTECLALHGSSVSGQSVAPAVTMLKKLLFSPYEAVRTSSSLAISSRLLQVPFPKQTMLTTDDVSEHATSTSMSSEMTTVAGGNNQVMIEEDSTASSVQYCCDGCSTVPILRRRWHCNVCPDFDLCEACYEVMDADRLPHPHTRDHPMSAIPIEIDSVTVDGNEIHFSVDELSEAGLSQVANSSGLHSSSPAIHVLEPNEPADFSASVNEQRIFTISATKRAVNSLLLRELIEQLRGWMETTSGIQAIPIMQLFYRLSSAVGGPFMDSSKPENLDLEKFVKWFLDEMNLNKSFSAKTPSSFGEVAILVFMFFTLMLRNWHQPGTETSKSGATVTQEKGSANFPTFTGVFSSPCDGQEKSEFVSQLLHACGALRQQTLINYLMDILQQLVHVFKSPPNFDSSHGGNAGTGCGALLSIRRGLPAGNFSPFFSDSYAKAHRADLFMDYHRLLLENTFRLLYSLVRPEKLDKSTEKEKVNKPSVSKDLKLDGYQDVLCSYINNPHTAFVRRYARRLFLHLCGSRTHYYNVRDAWQFSSETKKLYKLVSKSGGFHNPVPYERSVKLVKCFSVMCEVAAARPRNWQKYCSRHGDVLQFLLSGIFTFGEESVIQTLKLLSLAFYSGKDTDHSHHKSESDVGTSSNKGVQLSDSKKKKKSEDGTEAASDKVHLDMEFAIQLFTEENGKLLRSFIDSFLLEWNSTTVRLEAKSVLSGIWHHGKLSFKETMLRELLQKVKWLPLYGQNIVEYIELLTLLLGRGAYDDGSKSQDTELIDSCLTMNVIKAIFETLKSQNELLANHPNSRIYNTLSGLVEFDGYYLESEPCVACSCPEVPYSRMKLDALKSETKFTDNRIIVKCTGSFTIQAVTMNVHDARKSKSVKVLNLYYNNRPVADLAELKNNWSLWKRAKSCHLTFNQTELKVEFPIPITACNFMIELDSFYENLQASSLESLQCPRCSRNVTDKHGICSNCHENAYQCRQCRNINYENLDSFLCNECGYSKYGRFEFNFMAKPSFIFDSMENDEDMKKGLVAIESESENAHRRYQQLLGFKKPLLKLVSSIGDNDMDSQQKDSVQQMMVSLPGPSCKINRKIALLGVLYGEKCKAAFDSVSRSVQTLQGLRRVLMAYLQQRLIGNSRVLSQSTLRRSSNHCYGCATTFVSHCLELLQVLSKHPHCKKHLVSAGILSELFENNIHQGPKAARVQARAVLCAFSEGDMNAVTELNSLIKKKVLYCLEHHRSMDVALATREELLLLTETCCISDEFWEARLRIAFQLLFSSIKLGARHPAISEHIILPCLRVISQACTPPKREPTDKEQGVGKSSSATLLKDENYGHSSSPGGIVTGAKSLSLSSEKHWDNSRKGQDMQLLSYYEWEKGASYLDFVRRQYKVSQTLKTVSHRSRRDSLRPELVALKYALRWKWRACKGAAKDVLSTFEIGSWVSELVLSSCSQSIRSEMCTLIGLLCSQNSSRQLRLLNLLTVLIPATLSVGESAADYFELLFRMIESDDARLFLTVKGFLATICRLITQEVANVEAQERSLRIDISQGFILHKLIELLSRFLEVPSIRARFMRDDLLSQVLEALLVVRGLIIQKTKLISDCNRLLKDLLDGLLLESSENKRHFIRACISGLHNHGEERKGRTSLFILEQLCNLICPSKPEPVYLLILNKAHTQEEFIRGSMTKNPYSSTEIGPLMRDVKNKICHQLDLLGLLEDDYGMELLVAGNIISLDLSIAQVYEQVWRKSQNQSLNNVSNSGLIPAGSFTPMRDSPPMTVTYRLQGLDGEATEPMIKELEEEREESQDPEVEFAIAGAVREFGGLEIILGMIQRLRDDELKANKEEINSVLNLLMYCCKIRENRRALLRLGALELLLDTARRAFSVDAMEPAEGILLIVESLAMEANESDIGITQSVLRSTNEEAGAGEQAKKIVLLFLERLSHPSGLKKSIKQQRNNEMVARILPYLTYGEQAAMEALILHFLPYLQDWGEVDRLQKLHLDNPKDDSLAREAAEQRLALENFVRVSESLKTSSCGERLKDMILEKGITRVAIRHLKDVFAVAGQTGFKSSSEWGNGLKQPSVPLILSMLRGLSRGHFGTQQCIDCDGVLPLLHALEGVPGENEIGVRAENLLDTLSDKEGIGDGFLGEKVRKLRHATRDEMRRRALQKREELLQGLGMRQELSEGGKRIVVAQPVIEGLEDVEEEEGLACMVCREGYSLRPMDMLGVYAYSKRVNLGAGTSINTRGECVYTTVSHFNIIHFQCHQEAKRADAALKNPKKEWEGAALRNNETLCNCIFPLRGPLVPLTQYMRYLDQFWDNLNALGRAEGSRLRLLSYDIVLMLARFATGASFSTDSKGGGRESNSRLLPFMIQMARHLLDQGGAYQKDTISKAIVSYLATTPTSEAKPSTPSSSRNVGAEETVQFMMVNSVLAESYQNWLQHRCAFLQIGIYHTYMQYRHGRSTMPAASSSPASELKNEGSSESEENIFSIIQPMLVYVGLIEQLQHFFKMKRASSSAASATSASSGRSDEVDNSTGLEEWEVVMNERLLNVKDMMTFSKEVLGWLEDMQSASDLQEAFDIVGVLGDVLSGGSSSSCEEFVRAAIAGKT
ncbi:Auxin transport protein [Nymphaea thermarum]|nr:Auxin transport protein [Nymphaea thermarum]